MERPPRGLGCHQRGKQGLLANGTWDESKIRPKAEVLAEARAKGHKIHVGALMVIVSIKGYEQSPSEWIIKARIGFRGDAVRDEANQAAVFDELAASAPTSLGGLNMIIACGLVEGNACSTSDCIKVCMSRVFLTHHAQHMFCFQRNLCQLMPSTSINQLPPLIRSLYGHPLASASWQNHLATILSKELGGIEMPEQPSCFHVPSMSLALGVYVDDLTLSGTSKEPQ